MDEADLTASVTKWTDEELLDAWQSASDAETENPSDLLLAVIAEMGRREIGF